MILIFDLDQFLGDLSQLWLQSFPSLTRRRRRWPTRTSWGRGRRASRSPTSSRRRRRTSGRTWSPRGRSSHRPEREVSDEEITQPMLDSGLTSKQPFLNCMTDVLLMQVPSGKIRIGSLFGSSTWSRSLKTQVRGQTSSPRHSTSWKLEDQT